jgi:hypothetical protein
MGGGVVLDDPHCLPDGAAVRVEQIASDSPEAAETGVPTLYERLKPFIGVVSDLPPDMARNHDHYLHGAPRKE